jgi:hypothetical protein
MTHLALHRGSQISLVNSIALRKEIGERLRTSLDQTSVEMPPHLLLLVKGLHDEDAKMRPGQSS